MKPRSAQGNPPLLNPDGTFASLDRQTWYELLGTDVYDLEAGKSLQPPDPWWWCGASVQEVLAFEIDLRHPGDGSWLPLATDAALEQLGVRAGVWLQDPNASTWLMDFAAKLRAEALRRARS
jgi:hypothetical protein